MAVNKNSNDQMLLDLAFCIKELFRHGENSDKVAKLVCVVLFVG